MLTMTLSISSGRHRIPALRSQPRSGRIRSWKSTCCSVSVWWNRSLLNSSSSRTLGVSSASAPIPMMNTPGFT